MLVVKVFENFLLEVIGKFQKLFTEKTLIDLLKFLFIFVFRKSFCVLLQIDKNHQYFVKT